MLLYLPYLLKYLLMKLHFLVEFLRRKIKVALSQSRSADEFDDRSLVALSTLYGIELMEDNVKMLVMNMFSQFSFDYQSGIK